MHLFFLLIKVFIGFTMFRIEEKYKLSPFSNKIIYDILEENKDIGDIFKNSENEEELLNKLKDLAQSILAENHYAEKFYTKLQSGKEYFEKLRWKDFAAIRLLDYIKYSGESYSDPNQNDKLVINRPISLLWTAIRTGYSAASEDLFLDMFHLFRQLKGKDLRKKPGHEKTVEWLNRYKSGLDPEVVRIRNKNEDKILNILIRKIEEGEIKTSKFRFPEGLDHKDKLDRARKWWNDYTFHLKMAIKSSKDLKEMLGESLCEEDLQIIRNAEKAGIPLFINPYYLSLLELEKTDQKRFSDQTLRDYIFVNKELVSEFGNIRAWEKEDTIIPGEPNAAGWILPNMKGLHRRYPQVAIFIPQTTGRSCAGLCVSCQRMYDFQSGNLNFDLEKLKPKVNWTNNLETAMNYFRYDSQLRDILVTGGDAFMSSDHTLSIILDEILKMAEGKIQDNINRPEGGKYAEIVRVRMGTRLPAYLPQRFTPELIQILRDFKARASKIGIQQFFIQTHFVSPLEITPQAKTAVRELLGAGWLVTNQEVFTAAASRRGHSAKLRQVLNDIGILSYYTFQVKGYTENKHNFTPVSRSVQEKEEEKKSGKIGSEGVAEILKISDQPKKLITRLSSFRKKYNIPFLATDRSVFNLPGVGKSLSFRVIGLANDGRRILEFEHDTSREHSPIIIKMGKIIIIESKSVSEYMHQLKEMGEDILEYQSIYGYSAGVTEDRFPLYEYPAYNFKTTCEITNLKI